MVYNITKFKFVKNWRNMKVANDWQDYLVLDTGKGEKFLVIPRERSDQGSPCQGSCHAYQA